MTVSDWLADHRAAATSELFEFLRIPSISARSEHKDDVARAAAWLGEQFISAGLSAQVIPTKGHPIVLAEGRGAVVRGPAA